MLMPRESFVQGEHRMGVKYFSDTDTAHLEFTDNEVTETNRRGTSSA